jgi:quercetin dioxygenase-like cupin family protein
MRLALTIAASLMLSTAAIAADPSPSILNPKALGFVIPNDLKWTPGTPGTETSTLFGDPQKPGDLYGVLYKWKPNNFSRPHFHENDRHIYVISGTWWVGTGDVFDPANASVPMRAGSYVTHYGKQVHWDGAKDDEAMILIIGLGPAASKPSPTAKIPAEKK